MDGFWWAGVILCGIFIVLGSIGNGLTIGVFIKFSQFRNPLGFLILSLAVSDFFSSCLMIPLNLVYFQNEGKWEYSYELCCIHKIIGYGLVMHAAFLISFIAVNRYIKICRTPELYELCFSNWKVLIMSSLAAIYSLVIMTLITFKFGGGGVKLEKEECKINFGSFWYLIVTNVVFLTIIIAASYIKIYLKVLRSKRVAHSETLNLRETQKLDEANMRLLMMVTAITVAFIICFLIPLIIMSIARSHTNESIDSAAEVFFYQIPILASVCTNPIIYVLMNTQYTAAYYQLVTSIKPWAFSYPVLLIQ